jgi:hypothetical protein
MSSQEKAKSKKMEELLKLLSSTTTTQQARVTMIQRANSVPEVTDEEFFAFFEKIGEVASPKNRTRSKNKNKNKSKSKSKKRRATRRAI